MEKKIYKKTIKTLKTLEIKIKIVYNNIEEILDKKQSMSYKNKHIQEELEDLENTLLDSMTYLFLLIQKELDYKENVDLAKITFLGTSVATKIHDLLVKTRTNIMKQYQIAQILDNELELAKFQKQFLSNLSRIYRTETNKYFNDMTVKVMKKKGYKKYKIMAVMDNRTSEICRSMNGKVFKLSEKKTGVNCPPFHPNCRSVIKEFKENE